MKDGVTSDLLLVFLASSTTQFGMKVDKTKKLLSEVGFEPTPGEPDCDLNAAP